MSDVPGCSYAVSVVFRGECKVSEITPSAVSAVTGYTQLTWSAHVSCPPAAWGHYCWVVN